MRTVATFAILSLLPGLAYAAEKLTFEDRIELTRGLMAEYATVKVLLPRSKKPLEFESSGTYDKKKWEEVAKTSGPAARSGDMVQITRIDLDEDKIVLEINHGMKGTGHWYDHVQVGMGNSTSPISQGNSNAPSGTSIAILFHKPLEPIKAAEIKKMLAPVLDFEKRSSTELYADTLPPEIKQAIHDKRVTVGMDHDQVMLAMGRPEHKSRETKDGVELEDWVFGTPPGRITFVTFEGSKVIKVKEAYAGLGTEVADPKVPR
jgi:hypothetical protein